jgi:DNA (cytosine-5)-methyltransferase 1
MKHGSLFSGIGGFDLAADWMGWENVFHCEIAEFPRKILNHYWPNADCHEDIKKTDFTKYCGTVDIISGGFPCQPYSAAGKRLGKEDDRHLWPEMLRVIREVKPQWVVGENVRGLLNWNGGMVFHEVCSDLENIGYEVQAFIIPASGINAPHQRERLWIVAHTDNTRTNQRLQSNGEWKENDEQRRGQSQSEHWENGINGNVTDSNKYGRQEQYRNMGEENGNNEGQGNEFICNAIKHESQNGNVAHTNGTKQGNNIREDIGEKGKIRWNKKSDVFGKLRSNGNAPDSSNERLQRDKLNGTPNERKWKCNESRQPITKLHKIENWDRFPTQSPVCSGDDGISYGLDNITFPKWRNESIKGYGNAVVPQVVYRIFKTIEYIQNLNDNTQSKN